MLKNLILYRLGPEWPASADQLVEALAGEPFAPCAAAQQKSTGWVPPREEHGALVESVDGQWIARLMIETKSVPASEVKKRADAAADEIEHGSCFRLYQILALVLPGAEPRTLRAPPTPKPLGPRWKERLR